MPPLRQNGRRHVCSRLSATVVVVREGQGTLRRQSVLVKGGPSCELPQARDGEVVVSLFDSVFRWLRCFVHWIGPGGLGSFVLDCARLCWAVLVWLGWVFVD